MGTFTAVEALIDFCFLLFVVLGFELRVCILSHSTSLFL
jgi:hypothetical protein